MKNSQKGLVLTLLLVVLTLALAAGVAYVYMQKEQTRRPVIRNPATQTSNQSPSIVQPFAITSPKKGDVLTAGQTYSIKWTPSDIATSTTIVRIGLISSNIEGSLESFYSPTVILADGVSNNGNYSWTINPKTPTGSYSIAIIDDRSFDRDATTISGIQGDDFSIVSKIPAPVSPAITSISPNVAYVDKTKFGDGSSINVYGTGFLGVDVIRLMNDINEPANLDDQVTVDNSTGVPDSDTQFVISVPNNTPPGSYYIVVENTGYGLKSNPYPFTVASVNP
jgi:hypothetical protein